MTLQGPRIAPGAIPIILYNNSRRNVGGERCHVPNNENSPTHTEALSALRKYVRPIGRIWRTKVHQLLKLSDVEQRVCLKRAKIYSLIEAGDFPAPVKLSSRRSVWLADDIAAWVERKAEASRKMNGGRDDR